MGVPGVGAGMVGLKFGTVCYKKCTKEENRVQKSEEQFFYKITPRGACGGQRLINVKAKIGPKPTGSPDPDPTPTVLLRLRPRTQSKLRTKVTQGVGVRYNSVREERPAGGHTRSTKAAAQGLGGFMAQVD